MRDIGGFKRDDEKLVSLLPEFIPIRYCRISSSEILVSADGDLTDTSAWLVFYDAAGNIMKMTDCEYDGQVFRVRGSEYDVRWDVKVMVAKLLNDYHVLPSRPRGRRVSVVIPARDNEVPLRRTLASLCRQTIAPHEVIVCDDGSVPPINVSPYETFLPLTLIRNAGVGGRAYSRNCAIYRSSGDIVLCLDSDMIAEDVPSIVEG